MTSPSPSRPKLLVLTQGDSGVLAAQSPKASAKLERVLGLHSPTGAVTPLAEEYAQRILDPRGIPPTLMLAEKRELAFDRAPLYAEPSGLSYMELSEEQVEAMEALRQEKLTQRRAQLEGSTRS